MTRQKFETLSSGIVPLEIDNIDTDQIIPARFLKSNSRDGFGAGLFCDWRFDEQGNPREDFILNKSAYSGSILLAGSNFGCGSSREHAAWALLDFGFRVVLSSRFADIFKNNALNNGLLPLELPEPFLRKLSEACRKNPAVQLKIDLQNELVQFPAADGEILPFRIPAYKRQSLLRGQDDIDFLLTLQEQTERYEATSKYLQLLTASR